MSAKLPNDLRLSDLVEIPLPPVFGVDGLSLQVQNAPPAEDRLDLLLQGYLAIPAVEVVLGGGLEHRSGVLSRLVDFLKLPKAQQSAQIVGIGHVVFAAVSADEKVSSSVADQHPIHVGLERAGCPAGQFTHLHGETLLTGLVRGDAGDQFRL